MGYEAETRPTTASTICTEEKVVVGVKDQTSPSPDNSSIITPDIAFSHVFRKLRLCDLAVTAFRASCTKSHLMIANNFPYGRQGMEIGT